MTFCQCLQLSRTTGRAFMSIGAGGGWFKWCDDFVYSVPGWLLLREDFELIGQSDKTEKLIDAMEHGSSDRPAS